MRTKERTVTLTATIPVATYKQIEDTIARLKASRSAVVRRLVELGLRELAIEEARGTTCDGKPFREAIR